MMRIIAFLLLSLFVQAFCFQNEKCKYDSILQFKETSKITFKQVTKLSYYSQSSRFAIRRSNEKIDLVFSSVFGLKGKRFESFQDREKIQSYFTKKDYIIRIQLELPNSKLKEGTYKINQDPKQSIQCVVRLYHIDKSKSGMKLISRKYEVESGSLEIEKLTASSFCGNIEVKIPEYYDLSSSFSIDAIIREK